MKNEPTVDGTYAWAAANNVPAPDAFAMRYWYHDGKELKLRLAAAFWRYLVKHKATGFPAIDGD